VRRDGRGGRRKVAAIDGSTAGNAHTAARPCHQIPVGVFRACTLRILMLVPYLDTFNIPRFSISFMINKASSRS
jgi:hypothetical protein